MTTRKSILLLLLSAFCMSVQAASVVRTSKAPEGVALKHDFEVSVRTPGGEWKSVDTYLMNVDQVTDAKHNRRETSVAMFEFSGMVEIKVTTKTQEIDTFRIRPLSYGIHATRKGNTLQFTLDRPRYISVEVNGDIYNNLQIFADSPMNKPKVQKRDLIYFGPGLHDFKGDSISIPSGKTVFIDQGAVIRGWLSVYKANNVRILGHGIVMPGHHEEIMVRYSKNVLVDGPLTTQLPVGGSDSIEVRNCKVMSWYGWGDGFNIFASNNVRQSHLFARTSDDCSTIYCTRKNYHGGCRNISISDCVYWADVAHPIMIGLHSETPEDEEISDVVYDNIDILEHAENQIDYQGCIGINDGDNILVRDITFQNFNIESIRRGMLLNFRVCYNKKYCHWPGRGIEDITLRNITYNGQEPNMGIITGYDESRTVRNITFENLRINGRLIADNMAGKPAWWKTSDMANIFVGEHVENVTFLAPSQAKAGVITP